ncbi:MAG: hypothetical protein JNM94_16205 [Phycisphaerae bacterium]|nr:hypothetical protein [Phycisphaerae bacterium]
MHTLARTARSTGPIVRTLSRPAVHGLVAGLTICLTALPAGAQQQPTQPAQQAASSAQPSPPSPSKETQFIDTSSLGGRGASNFLNSAVDAMRASSGVMVNFVQGSNQIVVTGPPEKIAIARAMFEKLAEGYQSSVAAQGAGASVSSTGVSLDFKGGSVLDYLKQLGAATGFDGFVIREPALLEQIDMPPVTLRGTDLETAIKSITSSDRTEYRAIRLRDGRLARVTLEWLVPDGSTPNRPSPLNAEEYAAALRRGLVVVAVVPWTEKQVPTTRTVFDLSRVPNADKAFVQSLLDAISLAVELDGESPSFRAKYHEPSRILIVRGTDAEIALVREIIQLRVPSAKSHDSEIPKPDPVSAPTTPAATPSSPATPKSR